MELAVAWIYKHDPSLNLPYRDNLSALLHEPTFKVLVNEGSFYEGQPVDYISGHKTPRRYRNPFLAEAMAELQ